MYNLINMIWILFNEFGTSKNKEKEAMPEPNNRYIIESLFFIHNSFSTQILSFSLLVYKYEFDLVARFFFL